MVNWYRAQVLALLAMAMVDWLWTLHHLSRGLEEANPLLAWVLAVSGTTGFSVIKVGTMLCGVLLLYARSRYPRALLLLLLALAVYAWVMMVHVSVSFI